MKSNPSPNIYGIYSFIIIALTICLSFPVYAQTGSSITPISSFSNTQESTSSTSLVNSDVFIAGSNLENGIDYLILCSAAYGANSTSHISQAAVTYGGVTIASGSDEGSSSGSPEAMRSASLHGFYVLTGDGSSDLRIQWCSITGGIAYIKGKSLIAIPLEDLTESEDFWFVQQNGDDAEVTTTESFVDLLTMTVNLPEDGDYLVLMSAEGWTPSGSNSDGEQFRAVINTVVQKLPMAKEWEDDRASRSFSYVEVKNISAGNNTFEIEVGSAQGTASKSFRRGRIVVIKTRAFDQIISASEDSDITTTANHPAFDNFITQSYTPNQQEYVVIMGNTWSNQGQNYRSVIARLENVTDNTYFSDFISDDSKDINIDRAMLTVFGAEEISSPKTYALQISGESSYTTAHHFQYGDLIIWSMTLSEMPPVLDPIGAQFVDEGSHLEFVVTASDTDGDDLFLSVGYIPLNAAFTDSGNGHGLFAFDPDYTQSGVYPVRFIVSDVRDRILSL